VADSRLVLAQRLAVAGLAIYSVYHLDEVARASGMDGFLPVANPMARGLLFELSSLVLSAAAFAASWKKPSIIVSMLLIIMGALMVADGMAIGTKYFTVMTVPGPIIGFAYGVLVLALGLAKGIMTWVAMKQPNLDEPVYKGGANE
jgi:Ca2+/Na+ antiporter